MSNPTSQQESFSLVNIVPQNKDNNEHLWEAIEERVRITALHDNLYIVTGGGYLLTSPIRHTRGGIAIPDVMFKAVYNASTGLAGVYLTPNAAGGNYEIVSTTELYRRTGIDVFPTLGDDVKNTVASLGKPIYWNKSLTTTK